MDEQLLELRVMLADIIDALVEDEARVARYRVLRDRCVALIQRVEASGGRGDVLADVRVYLDGLRDEA